VPGPCAVPDFTEPSAPRIYDYLLGGKDNFAADRMLGEELAGIYPGLRALVRANRRFLGAAVTWTASEGTGQFADLGCGLPARPALHEVAQDTDPEARVVYVDRDPVVLSHVKAATRAARGVAVIAADVTDPGAVLGAAGLRDPRRHLVRPGRG
jgi:hypothetical protein